MHIAGIFLNCTVSLQVLLTWQRGSRVPSKILENPLPVLFLPLVKFECIPQESCAGNFIPNVLEVVPAEKCVGSQGPKFLHEPIP